MKSRSKSTICVHEGRVADQFSGINTPVFTSTSYGYLDTEERFYPRYFNIPNQQALVEKLAALEHAETGLVFSSGMAAISATLLSLAGPGDHVVFQRGLYGGTIHFIRNEFDRFGIQYTILPDNEIDTFRHAIRENTRIVYIETPSNPLLSVISIEEIGNICRSRNVLSVIDNTFASPVNQNPLDFGIDIVVHSGTKYLGGHSDLTAGAVLAGGELINRIRGISVSLGGSLNAMMCYLLERSLKTLALRVDRQNGNAMRIAEFLSEHRSVKRIYYPGLSTDPGYETARKQMTGFGGMVSFELVRDDIYGFQKRLKLIRPAMSLGGVESTICAPSLTSHRHLTELEREESGITAGLLRLSVGIEDEADLVGDLDQALK